MPLAPEKVEGQSTSIVFLGIELDSKSLTARLPADKLSRLQALVKEWGDRKSCTKRELLSLIGVLQHTSSVVRFGRCFLHHMINLSTTVTKLHHHIRLNREFRSDLQWWSLLAPKWNGLCFLRPMGRAVADVTVYSDASGAWGFGAFAGNVWLQGQWPHSWEKTNITAKELLPIVLAAALWGPRWHGKMVDFQCDNQAIVCTINSWRSQEPLVMQLLRGMALLAMEFSFHIQAQHIPGVDNTAAETLSRNNISLFFTQISHVNQEPTVIPEEIGQLFITQQPDWLSSTWKQNFRSFLQQVWPTQQQNPTL